MLFSSNNTIASFLIMTIYVKLERHFIYQNAPLNNPDQMVIVVFLSVDKFFSKSLWSGFVSCFFRAILEHLNIWNNSCCGQVLDTQKILVRIIKTTVKVISTNVLAIPTSGDAF